MEHAVLNLMGEALAVLPAKTVAPKASAAGRVPDYGQMSDGEIEALKTRFETAAGWLSTDALPGAGFGAKPHAG